ncbi:MAG TPA: hypothetical protein DD434_12445 [Bacteroidales bacterium]|nr:hypothetical protein [Bacteroidales bacterium]
MDIKEFFNNKSIKGIEKVKQLTLAITNNEITIEDIKEVCKTLKDADITYCMEAIEAVTNTNPEISNIEYLKFAIHYVDSKSNSLKRESARVIGNIAVLYTNDLDKSIKLLLNNSNDEGTVVRWSAAYALSRIIILPEYSNSKLYNQLVEICEKEEKDSIKNIYLKAFKKLKK